MRLIRNRTPLKLLFLLLLVGYLAAFALFLAYSWFDTVRDADERLDFRSSMLAASTRDMLYHYEGLLRLLAQEAIRLGVLQDPERARDILEQVLADNPALAGYGLTHPDGQLIVVSGIPAGHKLPNLLKKPETRETFRLALSRNNLTVGRSYWFPLLQRWIMPIRLPLRDSQGKVVLVSATGFDLESPELSWNRLQLPDDERLLLVRDDGYLQFVRPFHPRGHDDPLFQTPLPDKFLDALRQSERQGGSWRSSEGYCSSAPIDTYQLHAVVCMPLSSILTQWIQRLAIPTVVFLVLLSGGLFFYRLTRRMERQQIDAQQRHEAHLAWMAEHDSLTGLPNRVLLEDRLNQALHHARREQRKLGLIIADLDNFKRINDGLGHQIGDRLLMQVAERLSELTRASDTVTRFGGDEFIILVEDIEARNDLIGIADKILSAFRTPFVIDSHRLNATISLGIAVYPGDGETPEALIQSADTALYEAKALGRDRFMFYAQELNTRTRRYLELEAALRNAIANDEFHLHYQPQVEIASDEVRGVEALLRWDSSTLGTVSPAEFIPVAEDSGLIRDIGQWVMERAFEEIERIERLTGQALRLALNVSALELRGPHFVQRVQSLLAASGRPPERVEIEITEGVLVGQHTHAPELLNALNELGVRIAIDDFGTGYSSLAYLSHLPIDTLKVDQSFVRNLSQDPANAVLTRTIIAMGHSMGLEVVAEGVEDHDSLTFLRQHRCDFAQGYYFARPMPPEDLVAHLQGNPDQALR